ncbi:MAG: SRPBCC family protein [Bacteroidota bacterium]
MPIIRLETYIEGSIEVVFDLSRSIDLHKYSAQATNEEAIAGVTSGLIGLGESVTWRAKHFGIYQRLTSKITAFQRPDYFVDEMEKGVFKSFKHEHIFEEQEGQTLMIDVFHYISPLGFLGRMADKLFLENYMKAFLEKRNEVIKEVAETDKWKEILL